MDKALHLLNQIHENENISQRQLASLIDVSLGTVNAMIKELIQFGFISIDQTNKKQTKYFLTGEGRLEKQKRNYHEVASSYHIIGKAKLLIRKVIEEQLEIGVHHFYLYGEEDEIYKLIKMCLIECNRDHILNYEVLTSAETIDEDDKYCTLYWNSSLVLGHHLNAKLVL